MSTVTERILQYIEHKGITKYKFSKNLGVSNAFLDKPREITTDKYANILEYYPDINPEWLLTGKGEMLKEKSNLPIAVKTYSPDMGIPLIPTEAMGGIASGEVSILELDCERYVIPMFKDADFLIPVKGSSMIPKYNSGDVVACRIINERNFIQWNKTHVVATRDQGIIIKRIKPSEEPNCLLMVSDNSSYDPFLVPEEEIEGLAIVVGVVRLE